MESVFRRRMVVMLGVVGIVLGLLVAFNVFKGVMIRRALAETREVPQTVTTTTARLETWQASLAGVGTVRAIRGADLAFEGPGVVVRLDAQAGSSVKQGQLLVSLNDDAEQAQFRALKAAADLAQVTYARAREQMAAHIISQADFDSLEADLKAKEAAAQAQLATADKKRLRAPFAGRIGIIATSPGAYVTAGSAVLSLQQLDSVYVDFSLPQRDLGRVKAGQRVDLALDAHPGRTFTGRITAVNPRVDSGTRNVQVEATFPNPGQDLVPGMFANVTLDVGAPEPHLTLPQTAVTYNPYGSLVFLAVKDASGFHAQQVFVTTGATRGDQVAILKGLEPGAQVVTSGGLKLRNGTPLKVDNRVPPANEARPSPQER